MAEWLEREFTDWKVRGSNPTSASRPALSGLRQPGSIPALVLRPMGRLGITLVDPPQNFLKELSSTFTHRVGTIQVKKRHKPFYLNRFDITVCIRSPSSTCIDQSSLHKKNGCSQ
ncbi:hypothetical protein CSKR_113122 [Clonorchis sinensis]|uniref:Uncharacterized protein n=1 Tax=Clonorchis sinensis TaxID=79923 RepID=A0A419Q9G6_CLOSI|nr:hypothetical protein CSKR_113122 [Clonorchis sinensis]